MEFVSLEEIKQQCYLDGYDMQEDNHLRMLASAAVRHVENYTNRKLYMDPASIPQDSENALLFTDDIKIAVLLLVGHFYENRENSTEKRVENIPYGFHAMVGPYKYIPV